MKALCLSVIILLSTLTIFAQKGDVIIHPLVFSLGAEVQIPIGSFAVVNNVGFGASAQGEYRISSSIGLTLNGGYINFPVKLSSARITGLIPILGGAKIWLSGKAYFHGQLGASLPTNSGGATNFTYSPGLGFQLGKNIDALVKYVGLTSKISSITYNYNTVGLRLAFSFNR